MILINNTPEQDKRLLFDEAYWLSKPHELRAFQKMQNTNPDGTLSNARGMLAVQLTQQGFDIDVPIMVWDEDPYYIMLIRENEGVTRPQYANGKTIKVSSNIADYPPFDPPIPPIVPPPVAKLVGNWAYSNVYFSTEAGKAIPDYNVDPIHGQVVEGGFTYRKSITVGVMGPSAPTHLFYRQ